MAMSGPGGSVATELSRGGHGWWRAAWAPGREHEPEPPGLALSPDPGAPMFLVILGEIKKSLSLSCPHFFFFFLANPVQHVGSQLPDQGLNLCPCNGSMVS